MAVDSIWTDFGGERYHVLGIAITDPDLVHRTRRVVQCCVGLVGVLIVRATILLTINEAIGTTLVSMIFNLAIPTFGYLGARDGSATLMCVFVAMMTINAANALALLAMILYVVIEKIPQRDPVTGRLVPFEMTKSVWAEIFLVTSWALMALVAAHHSRKLFAKLSQGEAVAERYNADPEIGLPEIDTKLEEAPDVVGKPVNRGKNIPLQEMGIDDDFIDSPITRQYPVKKGQKE
jgi:hypothetical protein